MTQDTQNGTSQAGDGIDENLNKFLSFNLDKEEYGVEILRVREIIGVLDITPLPQSESYVKGVVNLRGKIIPVIELRNKFGMESIEYDEETCIVVVEISDTESDEQTEIGLIVDSVHEVKNIAKSQIEPAPKFGCSLNPEYIHGMGKVTEDGKQRVLILLDIDKVLPTDSSVLSQASDVGEVDDEMQKAA
jgi:purine-binding chemotaxis protein CheW